MCFNNNSSSNNRMIRIFCFIIKIMKDKKKINKKKEKEKIKKKERRKKVLEIFFNETLRYIP